MCCERGDALRDSSLIMQRQPPRALIMPLGLTQMVRRGSSRGHHRSDERPPPHVPPPFPRRLLPAD